MCAYCEERKPLFTETKMTGEKMIMRNTEIVGRKIVAAESVFGWETYFKKTESDFELDFCPKCGKGLAENTMDVQRLREMDKD